VKWPDNRNISISAKEFILGLITKEPGDRFSALQALKHKWLTGEAATENLGSELLQNISNYSEACKLKKMLVRMLSDNMTRDDHEIMRTQFDQIDLDGNGMVDIKDLTNFLSNQGRSRSDAEARATYFISQVDQNNDGVVFFEEFKDAKLACKIGNDEKLLRKHFQLIDADNNGFITHDELSKLFNWTLTTDVIENMIKEVDESNDGKICYQEFVKAMRHGALKDDCK